MVYSPFPQPFNGHGLDNIHKNAHPFSPETIKTKTALNKDVSQSGIQMKITVLFRLQMFYSLSSITHKHELRVPVFSFVNNANGM